MGRVAATAWQVRFFLRALFQATASTPGSIAGTESTTSIFIATTNGTPVSSVVCAGISSISGFPNSGQWYICCFACEPVWTKSSSIPAGAAVRGGPAKSSQEKPRRLPIVGTSTEAFGKHQSIHSLFLASGTHSLCQQRRSFDSAEFVRSDFTNTYQSPGTIFSSDAHTTPALECSIEIDGTGVSTNEWLVADAEYRNVQWYSFTVTASVVPQLSISTAEPLPGLSEWISVQCRWTTTHQHAAAYLKCGGVGLLLLEPAKLTLPASSQRLDIAVSATIGSIAIPSAKHQQQPDELPATGQTGQ